MKKLIGVFTFFLGIVLQVNLYAQTNVEINGTVKSKLGAVQGALVEFYDLNDDFQGNCLSGTNGKFRSENKMRVGRTIKIRVSKEGFQTVEKNVKIDNTGNAGEFMVKTVVIISGFVKDSMSDMALPGAEIFFYDQAKLIETKSTNSKGYFDFETDFIYGQKITVRVSKKGYYDKEQTRVITSEGRNKMEDFELPEFDARGLRAFFRIKDKKTEKPLGGATVHYFDKKKSTYIDAPVSSMGELELKLFQRPGTTLEFQIRKPRYRTIQAERTLSEDPLKNVFSYELEQDRRSPLGTVLLIGSGASAVAGGGLYLTSKKQYDRYKPFDNADRQNDYNKANNTLTMAVVAGGVAAGALVGFIITKIREKNLEKALERKKTKVGFNRILPFNPPYAAGNASLIAINYEF